MFCVLRFNTQSLPREFELSYQQEMINYIRSFYTTEEDEETVCTILDDDDSRVCHVKSLIKSIAEACIYFSPECESYMNNLEVLVVDDDDDLNAYVTMGSVLVVSSGLLRYYENLQSQGKIANSDEVAVASPSHPQCVACILAHELAHMLSRYLSPSLPTFRHPVESMLRWTSIAYHVYITMVPDLVLMPCIKSVFDRWISREQEHEADFQALYLLKRAGYDPAKLLETLAMLPEGTMYRDVLSKTRELVDNHPSVPKRIEFLRSRMDAFEQDFKERYQVKERHVEQRPSFAKFLLSFAGLY